MSENPYKKTPFPDFKDIGKMSEKEAKKEVEMLRESIEYHNHLYYVENDPKISDSKYDRLLHRLMDIEENFPDLQSDISPTRKVGAPPVDRLEKMEHAAPMLSLNSSNKKEAVHDFVKFIRDAADGKETVLVLEPKLDGLSVEVKYENGTFQYGVTRGDGETGEDVSENVKTIGPLPLKLRKNSGHPDDLSVRGEIFMEKTGFQDMNKERIEQGKEPFANARNAAAGIIRQLDPTKVANKPLDIHFYEILNSRDHEFDSHWKMLKSFPEWGLKTSPEIQRTSSLDEIDQYYNHMAEKREKLAYEIDGVVIKLDDRNLREKLGSRRRSPRWAFAWKFQPQKETTTLRDIIIQVGRTGILTPVALLDPVEVGGVTISRATLHNEDEAQKKEVQPGDRVRIIRAGDVIPEVSERVEKGHKKNRKAFKMPDQCPVCQTKVMREGAHVICPAGLSCEAQLKGSLTHFTSQQGMNIQNLGPKIIEQMVQREMIQNIPDLYALDKGDLESLDGFAKKSAKKLHEAIQASKTPNLDAFLYALGIRHVGRHMASVLARAFSSLEGIRDATAEELLEIQEVGPEIAESVSHFFGARKNREMLKRLKQHGVKVQDVQQETSQKLKGKTFVLTGELEAFTRDEAKEKIELLGGRATSSVSDQTSYLVVGDEPGKKLDEAGKKNIDILNEKEFLDLINNQ